MPCFLLFRTVVIFFGAWLAVGAAWGVALAAEPTEEPAGYRNAACEGSYQGHLQGIAVDGKGAVYWSFTKHLVKTDIAGKIVKKVDVPSHAGGVTFRDGKLYCAMNFGQFNREPGHADSWVWVFDGKSLKVLKKHPVKEVVHGAGGITNHQGQFFVIGGLPEEVKENYVYQYDGAMRFVRKHVIASGHTDLGIQTAAFADGFFWFGCYGKKLLKTDTSFRLVGKYDFDCALGVDGVEVAGRDGQMLVGRALGGGGNRGQVIRFVQDERLGMKPVDAEKP